MTATMIKMENGYFIPNIDGFEPESEMMHVDINIISDKDTYKEQLAVAIVEQYEAKKKNQITFTTDAKSIENFRKVYDINMTEEEFWDSLK